jgi:hypothetical protein
VIVAAPPPVDDRIFRSLPMMVVPSMILAGEPARPCPSFPIVMRNALRWERNGPSRKLSIAVTLCARS